MRQSRGHATTSLSLIRSAFAVRERLGDPRDLPYFRMLCFPCMLPTLPRRSAVPSCCTHTTIPRFLVLSIESRTATPSLPAILDGLNISGLHRSLYVTTCTFA